MDNEKMGQFITELRKSLQMTQKDLAVKLNVSDKAVSKWERGLSYPDISLLTPLSDILGITIPELLNGKKNDPETMPETPAEEASLVSALAYGEKTATQKFVITQTTWAAVFSIVLLLGITVVAIVNVAASGAFTWSLITISACVFAWLVFFPSIKFGLKGIILSLASLTLFITPFLLALDYTINKETGGNAPIFATGIRIAPLALVFLWAAYFLFKKFKHRKLLAVAFLILLASPISLLSNYLVAQMQGSSLAAQMQGSAGFNASVILNTFTPVAAAIILFIIEHVLWKKKN